MPECRRAPDDLFADPASMRTLLHLRSQLLTAGALPVLSESTQPGAVPEPRTELLGRTDSRVTLLPLSRGDIQRMLTARLDEQSAAGELSDPFHTLSGGNPLLVEALIRDYRRRTGDGAAPVTGDAYRQAVLYCLSQGGPHLVRIACAAAILGDLATPPVLAEVLGMPEQLVTAVVARFDIAGLISAGRFSRPEARAAVLDSLPDDERWSLHRRAAAVLREAGMSPANVARHLFAAHDQAGPWAWPALDEAARRRHHRFSVGGAAEYLTRPRRKRRNCHVWRPGNAAPAPTRPPQDIGTAAFAERPHAIPEARTETPRPAQPRPTRRSEADAAVIDYAEHLLRHRRLDRDTQQPVTHALLAMIRSGRAEDASYWCEKLLSEPATADATTWRATLTTIRASIALRDGDLPSAERYARSVLMLMPPAAELAVGDPLSDLLLATPLRLIESDETATKNEADKPRHPEESAEHGNRAGYTTLSIAERRVAVLAGRGYTNREIARTLTITVSTVEQHLTRVYRKLDINGRKDLASALLSMLFE